jgi:hypothetical protein
MRKKKNLKGREHLNDWGIDRGQDVDWIQLDQNHVQRRTLVNTLINFRIIRGRAFPDWQTDYRILKKDIAPWL